MRSKRFVNPYLKNNRRTMKDVVLWQLGYYDDQHLPVTPPEDFEYPNPLCLLDKSQPQVTWVNHCSFVVRWEGMTILTDPIWSDRCSPFPFMGPKRTHAPGVDLDALEMVDIVLISHDHYDHLDEKTVRRLNKKFPNIWWMVPQGVKKWFDKRGFANVREFSWWQKGLVGPFTITAVPCQHFSGRGLFDHDSTLWVGYVLETEDKRMYFVGDTGYNEYDFSTIGDAFDGMDLAMIPVGTYVPHKFMDPVHICPVRACSIHQEVKSRKSVGMHWKTFRLSAEELIQPPFDLYLTMQENGLDPLDFRVLEPGQTINW